MYFSRDKHVIPQDGSLIPENGCAIQGFKPYVCEAYHCGRLVEELKKRGISFDDAVTARTRLIDEDDLSYLIGLEHEHGWAEPKIVFTKNRRTAESVLDTLSCYFTDVAVLSEREDMPMLGDTGVVVRLCPQLDGAELEQMAAQQYRAFREDGVVSYALVGSYRTGNPPVCWADPGEQYNALYTLATEVFRVRSG